MSHLLIPLDLNPYDLKAGNYTLLSLVYALKIINKIRYKNILILVNRALSNCYLRLEN